MPFCDIGTPIQSFKIIPWTGRQCISFRHGS